MLMRDGPSAGVGEDPLAMGALVVVAMAPSGPAEETQVALVTLGRRVAANKSYLCSGEFLFAGELHRFDTSTSASSRED